MTNLGGDPWFVSLLTHQPRYSEINVLHGHEIAWYDDDGHARGHLNPWIFKLNTQLLN